MSTELLPTHPHLDLRSPSIDRLRASSSKHKWSPRWAYHPSIPHVVPGPNGTERPSGSLESRNCARNERRRNERFVQHARKMRKVDAGCSSESAAKKQYNVGVARKVRGAGEEGFPELEGEACATGPPSEDEGEDEEEVMYNYAAGSTVGGPRTGEAVLEARVREAEARWEDGVVRALVRAEYEVLDDEETSSSDGGKERGSGADEDGFELV